MPDINQLITDWGYAGIFLVVILGDIGLPVPEKTVLAVAGYLVWSGRLQLLPVLLLALVSAVVGDNFGYWLGRRYGRATVECYAHWLLKPGRVVVAESFVSRYGALAVCVARFVGGFRFLAGPLAGSVGLPFRSQLPGVERQHNQLRAARTPGACSAAARRDCCAIGESGRARPSR